MRTTTGYLAAFAILLSAPAYAEQRFESEKIKTGILPSGGLYSLYTVACDDDVTAAVASLNGKRRWCISDSTGMTCFTRKHDAAERACMPGALASADDNFQETDKYQ